MHQHAARLIPAGLACLSFLLTAAAAELNVRKSIPDGSFMGAAGYQSYYVYREGASEDELASVGSSENPYSLGGEAPDGISLLLQPSSLLSLLEPPRVGQRAAQVEIRSAEQAAPGTNIRVNNPALDPSGKTQSESSIAVDGPNVLVTFNDHSAVTRFSGYGYSTDGGNTFVHSQLPPPDGGRNIGDGVAAFGTDGEIYYSTMSFTSNGRSIVGVAKSTDNGRTFRRPVDASTTAGGTGVFQDKPWLAVDKSPRSPHVGNIYVSWTALDSRAVIFVARSTNRGDSFDPPVQVSPTNRFLTQGSMPSIAPDGTLYVAYFDAASTPGISIVRSIDGGATFTPPTKMVSFNPVGAHTGGGTVTARPWPSITVDKNENIHIAYSAVTQIGGLDRSDIYYVRSTDRGETFSTARRINDDATTTSQFSPSIVAAPDGTLAAQWWDRRNDPSHDGLTDVYMAVSTNGGQSFGKNFRITDHNWAFGPTQSPGSGYHGDYDVITADATSFFLAWSDERNGDPDVYFARVPLNRDPAQPDFNISGTNLYDTVLAGELVSFDFDTNSSGGLSGAVSLSTLSQIPGITLSFANDSISLGQRARLFVATNSSTLPGTYLLTVAAERAGITRRTNVSLTVYDPARFAGRPVNATDTRGFTATRSMQVDRNGVIHLVFHDDSEAVEAGAIFHKRSTDGGLTFSNAVKISEPGASSRPSLAIDPAANLCVVWAGSDWGGERSFFSRSSDGGASFTSPEIISGPNHLDVAAPRLGIDRSGRILVTYVDGIRLFAVSSTNGGATFGSPIQVSNVNDAVHPSGSHIAFDSRGAAYLTYNFGDVQSSPVIHNRIKVLVARDGQTFGAPIELSSRSFSNAGAHIAVDKNDNVFVAFDQFFSAASGDVEIKIARSIDGGTTFSELNVSNNQGRSRLPYIIPDVRGGLSVVWEDTTNNAQGDIFIAQSGDSGKTFSTPINLSANAGQSISACGSADSSGHLLIGWTDDSMANTDFLVAGLVSITDFGIGFNPGTLSATRGEKVDATIGIMRTGFASTLTLIAPETPNIKIKPPTLIANGSTATFKLKIKQGAAVGTRELVFTARDESGRTRTATLKLTIE